LRKHALARPGLSTAHAPEILPLFSRLSASEQDRIFKPSGHQRRIVLATNVAETSLTVPGIRYVIDTGLARVKRYSYRNKVEQLQVEPISQAAARQRAGRCGRVAAGVCVRLYDEADFNARAPFTDPEILRSSLAGVILRMKSLRLTDVESFPFIEPPPAKAISDGYALLQELGALDEDNRLTRVGDALARLPLDPRIGRMLVAARDLGCLTEVLIIAAALSVQDPRERPQERQQAADEKHRQFADEKSEFLSWVKLWAWFQNAVEHKKSNRQLVDTVHSHFLSYLRLREWREVHGQLHAMVTELGWKENELPGTYDAIHMALLSGPARQHRLQVGRVRLLPRGARHPLPDPPVVAAAEEGRQVDHGGRDHRDDAPVRPLRRPHRARLDRESGRSPDQAPVLRPALGKEIDAGRRLGADDALRRRDRPQAAHPLRPAGAGRGARDLHPPGLVGEEIDESFAGAGRSSSTTRSRSATSRRSSTSSAGRTCWSTTS
jgi:HrpA-like RNA helicase